MGPIMAQKKAYGMLGNNWVLIQGKSHICRFFANQLDVLSSNSVRLYFLHLNVSADTHFLFEKKSSRECKELNCSCHGHFYHAEDL